MNVDKTMQSAFENHQKGNFEQAEYFYKKILKKQPDNPDILHMLGVLFCQMAQYDYAIAYIRKALQFQPADSASAYCNLGVALQGKGQIDEAITQYRKAIEFNPSFDKAYCNLGNALHRKGQTDGAIAQYRKAIELNPSFAKAYCNLGNALREQGYIDEAITQCRKAIELNPSFAEAYSNLGAALREKGCLDEAIPYCLKAIELNPSFDKAYCNLGNALKEKGQIDEAIAHYRKAIELNPSFAETYSNLGAALREKGCIDEAIPFCLKAIELNPSFAEAYSNLGNALKEKGKIDEAMAQYRKAIELDPSYAEAYFNLAVAQQENGQFDEAVPYYQKALEINPDYAAANFNMSVILLQSGNFRGGWDKYEWRWKEKDFLRQSCIHKPGEFSQPLWDGSSLEGKSLLIYAEQGVGDEIMFASCFKDVIERAKACTVECDDRLISLFSRSFPAAVFIGHVKKTDARALQLPESDVAVPMGSLPKYLRTELNAFPRESYHVPDADKVEVWLDRFRTLGEGLKIGVSWRGGAIPKVRQQRSIMLEQWAGLLSLTGVHFINLQYGDCSSELRDARDKMNITIHDWEDADPLKDLDNFAAQIAALDLVISVDNATVHMAGALGKPVWVLLPHVPDWRWMLHREDSPWYPNILLFRQPSAGDWEPVVAEVKDKLLVISSA
jgi:tetratricopeptide (TPR) repeat protein